MVAVTAAAVDLGSNSFHLVVARIRPERLLMPIFEDKVMLGLGEVVARYGVIDEASAQRAARVFEDFVGRARDFGAEVIVAAATASFRDAANGYDVAAELEARSGVRVRILSGHEEAATIFSAVRSAGSIGEIPVVVADLGGGSLELALGTQRGVLRSRSLPLGVGKLVVRFDLGDPPDLDVVGALREHVERRVGDELAALRGYEPRRLILTSGTFSAIARVARDVGTQDDLDDGQILRVLDRGALLRAIEALRGSSRQRRIEHFGVDPRRVDTVVGGAVVLETLLEGLAVGEVWSSRWALREGLLIDTLEEDTRGTFAFDAAELRPGSVRHLLAKYRVDEPHARAVERYALALFDVLAPALGLGPEDRELASLGALLHDLGVFVASRGHDRHGAYLVAADPPRGLSRRERLILEGIVGNHRRGPLRQPSGLDGPGRRAVQALSALVRVADALDASHAQPIEGLVVRHEGRELTLEASSGEALGAERRALTAKAQLLEELLGATVKLRVVPSA